MLCNQIAFLDPRMSPVSQMKSRTQAPFHARAGDDRCHMKIGTPHIGDPGSRNILGTPGSPFSQDFGGPPYENGPPVQYTCRHEH